MGLAPAGDPLLLVERTATLCFLLIAEEVLPAPINLASVPLTP
jgi:hypothetical protein